jgi:hypothetical protein
MSFAKAVWGTVVGGVILIPITWGLEAIKDKLPFWLNWLGDGASVLWYWLSTPRPVATWVILLVIAAFARVVYEANHVVRTAKAAESERARKERESAAVLTEEEALVMDALAWADGSVEINELQAQTKLTRLRLEHALTKLRNRLYVRQSEPPRLSWRPVGLSQASAMET